MMISAVVPLVIIILNLSVQQSKSQVQTIYIVPKRSICPVPGPGVCFTDIGEALKSVSTADSCQVTVYPGTYSLTDPVKFTGARSISIERLNSSTGERVVVTCEDSSSGEGGLTFVNSHDIRIAGLVFQWCGVLHQSTSKNFENETLSFLSFHAALYFLSCSNITLTDNGFNESTGIAVQMYSVGGINKITNNSFFRNANSTKGGGLYIEFPYCLPLNTSSCVITRAVSNALFLIKHNKFEQNFAMNADDGPVFILPHKEEHYAFGRGGGLCVYFKGNSNRNVFSIENNTFDENVAVFGGGMFLEFQDTSNHNNVTVSDCKFNKNKADQSGGGVHFSFFSFDDNQPLYNTIQIDSVFFLNGAISGGGVSLEVSRERGFVSPTNKVNFINCFWHNNEARLGAGLDVTLSGSQVRNEGALINVLLRNSSFIGNSVNVIKDIHGYGALYANAVPITFEASVQFLHNFDGSALVATQSMITFESNTSASFISNEGRNGAAISLLESSYILIYNKTTFEFIGNQANVEGGAIYAYNAGGRNLASSRNCFLKYYDLSKVTEDWKTKFIFYSNKANGMSNSIFVTSIKPCIWGRPYEPANANLLKPNETFCQKSVFNYIDSSCVNGTQIKTDASNFTVPKTLKVVPGVVKHFKLNATDDRGTDVTSDILLTARTCRNMTDASCKAQVDPQYKYISSNSILLNHNISDKKNDETTLILETIGPRVIRAEVAVSFPSHCPPGYILKGADCRCPDHGSYYHYVVCHCNYSSILIGYWMGKMNEDSNNTLKIVVGRCRFCDYADNLLTSGSHVRLPTDFNEVQNSFCGKTRKGVLCSHCSNGAPAINSVDFECVHCNEKVISYSWIVYLLLKVVVPFGIFLVLYFSRVSFVSGYLNGPILFAQLISTIIPLDADGNIPYYTILPKKLKFKTLESLYRAGYAIWNLEFCPSCFNTPCLHPKMNDIKLLLLDYAIAFLPLLFVLFISIIYWIHFCKGRLYSRLAEFCSHRCPCIIHIVRCALDPRRLKNGLIASVVLSYSKICIMTGYLLAPIPLYNAADDGDVSDHELVLLFNGSITFFGKEHRKFGIPVAFVSGVFLLTIPLVLIFHRFDNPERNGGFFNFLLKAFQKDFRPTDSSASYAVETPHEFDPKINCLCHQYDDRIEIVIKRSLRPLFFSFQIKIFHGFIRFLTSWGQDEYRWVAGSYLLIRFLFVFVFAAADNYMDQYIGQIGISIAVGLFFLVCSPYKKRVHNIIDGVTFLLLAVILLLSVYQFYRSLASLELVMSAFVVQYLLVFLPSIWITLHVAYQIYCQSRILCSRERSSSLSVNIYESQPLVRSV